MGWWLSMNDGTMMLLLASIGKGHQTDINDDRQAIRGRKREAAGGRGGKCCARDQRKSNDDCVTCVKRQYDEELHLLV